MSLIIDYHSILSDSFLFYIYAQNLEIYGLLGLLISFEIIFDSDSESLEVIINYHLGKNSHNKYGIS